MEAPPSVDSDVLIALQASLRLWRDQSNRAAVDQWLTDELDASGAPVHLPLREWPVALRLLAEASKPGDGWSPVMQGRIVDFVRMLLRFSRPGGKIVTAESLPERPRAFWKLIAARFPAEDVGRVLDWWFPGDDLDPVPPPMPAWSATDRVQGVLRADWTSRGDIVAFDHREGADASLEVYGSGISWLGPHWSPSWRCVEAVARPLNWTTSFTADVAEWRFGSVGAEITRLALMLRGRRLALLADFSEVGIEPDSTLDLPAGLGHEPLPVPGAATLRPRKPGRSAQVILLGPGETSFDEQTRRLRLRTATGARWTPLIVSWEHARHRKPLTWTELTVTEQGMTCATHVAWAVRVSWGRDETYVFYRSLGPTARRSFLGYSTTARLFVGRFTTEGDVEPLATLP